MKILVDTHALIWHFEADPRLAARAATVIQDPQTRIWTSVASLWEIAIKLSLGKLRLGIAFPDGLVALMKQHQFQILPIRVPHLQHLLSLPHHHGDPFDRMIAAQASTHNMIVTSKDTCFDQYGVARLWT